MFIQTKFQRGKTPFALTVLHSCLWWSVSVTQPPAQWAQTVCGLRAVWTYFTLEQSSVIHWKFKWLWWRKKIARTNENFSIQHMVKFQRIFTAADKLKILRSKLCVLLSCGCFSGLVPVHLFMFTSVKKKKKRDLGTVIKEVFIYLLMYKYSYTKLFHPKQFDWTRGIP